jgi:hypothetical protein
VVDVLCRIETAPLGDSSNDARSRTLLTSGGEAATAQIRHWWWMSCARIETGRPRRQFERRSLKNPIGVERYTRCGFAA